MIPNCHRHQWDQSEDECRSCGQSFCEKCLVYVHGATARPMCINCALKKSGVRGSKRVKPSRRERRITTKVAKWHERERSDAARTSDDVAAQDAAATAVDLAEARQRGWASLDASRWDVGAI